MHQFWTNDHFGIFEVCLERLFAFTLHYAYDASCAVVSYETRLRRQAVSLELPEGGSLCFVKPA